MKSFLGMTAAALLLAGCTGGGTGDQTQSNSDQGGGSKTGAGGAGPGYDGTGSGSGEYGTVPESGAVDQGQAGHSQTNTAMPSASERPPVPTGPPE